MNDNTTKNVYQSQKSQTYAKHVQQNENVPISLTPWTKGIRRRPAHKSEQDEDTRAPFSSKELELEKQNRKSGQDDNRTPTNEKQEWHSRPLPSQIDESPRSQRLERELQIANDALIQLKQQVDQTRKKRLSQTPVQTFNTPKVRGSPNANQHNDKNEMNWNTEAKDGLGLYLGPDVSVLHKKIEKARDHARHHEGRPLGIKKHHREVDCDPPKHTHLPSVKAKNQWAVFATTASPVIPSSTHSTPQISSTPTFQSSTWTESPIVTSTDAFTSTSAKGAPSPSPTPFTSSQQSNSQQQDQSDDNHVVLASALAGSLTGAVLLALLALWAILSCRKRKRREKELSDVLDKVAPPRSPSMGSSQRQVDLEEKDVGMHDHSNGGNNVSEATSPHEPVEVRIVPSLDVPQLYPNAAANLEAIQRHSHELASSGIIAKGVRSDASFTWKFPKLSVPPAAARAIQSGHYVKKRLTMPTERSLQSFSDRSSIAPSKSGRTSFDVNKRVGPASVSDSTISTSFLFAHHGSTNASSEKVDPQIDHKRRTFVEEQTNSKNDIPHTIIDELGRRTAHTGSLPSSIGVRDWFRSERNTQDLLRKQEMIQSARNSTVILAHDPIMQNVMQKVLAMSEDTNSVESHQSSSALFPAMPIEFGRRITMEADQISILTSAISDDAKEDWKFANRALNGDTSVSSMHEITPFRPASWAGSPLETCREDSQESEQVSRDLRSASESKHVTGKRSSLLIQDAHQDNENDKRTQNRSSDEISAHYSAHSIIVHSVDDDIQSQAHSDWESSIDHSIPIVPNLRPRSSASLGAPKILLTSTEEDGKHERQISVTSIETTKSSTSKASSTSSNQDGFFDINSSIIFSDMANAIGQAYEEKIQNSIHYDHQTTEEQDRKQTFNQRDSESTLDSLVAYSRERHETLIMQTSQDSMEGEPFNERFSRAASRMGFNDDSQLIEVQRNSVTPSETGTLCLIDDDFPTIPSWKPMQNTTKQNGMRSLDSQERSLSNNYF
ncbi:uncharacterized protein FA14DRAFT_53083 [Meira miltonrushii]|uniref:Uncharacterized protein n=1 Tax=Meira miltonrushii TaxID=1280837 RepID=A0A316VGS1_9BASI|nr:uncharacterized protein FA14DRAFT_53083 [Meira miltonrushii]PWN36228.1 hypothetical protein FA14DRAFT_53083 [Meira miltonrushii]